MKKRYTVTLEDSIVKEAKKKAIDENMQFSPLLEKLLERYIKEKRTFS